MLCRCLAIRDLTKNLIAHGSGLDRGELSGEGAARKVELGLLCIRSRWRRILINTDETGDLVIAQWFPLPIIAHRIQLQRSSAAESSISA